MDEAELLYAMELRQKKDDGQDISPEAEGDDVELSGLSEEGSVYDSEEDKKALKEAKRKRQSSAQKEKDSSKKKRTTKTKWAVCPESVANIGGPASMLGKSMSRYNVYKLYSFSIIILHHSC
jgi:phosphoenolpyruvate-protein kinase (PTS system EI component)